MPRHNRPTRSGARRADEAPPRSISSERRETYRGVEHVVRTVPAGNAVKTYRCPGCDQEIRAGVPHVVAWPDHELDAGNRRHWHSACWAARESRGPTGR